VEIPAPVRIAIFFALSINDLMRSSAGKWSGGDRGTKGYDMVNLFREREREGAITLNK
jgi:hypothetical protein